MTRAELATPPAVPHRDPRALRLLSRTGRVASALAGAIGVTVLVSWMGGPRFARSGGQPIEVSPITAVGLVLAAAVLLLQGLHHPAPRVLRRAAALAVVAISIARVVELAAGLDLRLESALAAIHSGLSGGGVRMLPATAGALLATGLALLALEGRRRWRVTAQVIALALSPVPLVALVGYAYRVTLFYESSPVTAMALPTAIALLLLVIALLLARAEEGFVANLATAGTGGAMARRMLAYALALPLAIGWIALATSGAGPKAAFAVSVVVVALTMVLALLVLRDAAALDRMELAAERAQAELLERNRTGILEMIAGNQDLKQILEAGEIPTTIGQPSGRETEHAEARRRNRLPAVAFVDRAHEADARGFELVPQAHRRMHMAPSPSSPIARIEFSSAVADKAVPHYGDKAIYLRKEVGRGKAFFQRVQGDRVSEGGACSRHGGEQYVLAAVAIQPDRLVVARRCAAREALDQLADRLGRRPHDTAPLAAWEAPRKCVAWSSRTATKCWLIRQKWQRLRTRGLSLTTTSPQSG